MSDKTKQTEVRIIDQALVASFMGATPPSVWRVDLGRIDSASFELGTDSGKTVLYMRTAGGQRDGIAIFAEALQAQQALEAVSKAIFKGGGSSSCAMMSGGLGRKLVWGVSIALIVFLFLMMSAGGRQRATTEGGAPQETSSSSKTAPAPRPGVPLPADEVFGN